MVRSPAAVMRSAPVVTPFVETHTANYGWTKPESRRFEGRLGRMLNADLDSIDSVVHSISTSSAASSFAMEQLTVTARTLSAPSPTLPIWRYFVLFVNGQPFFPVGTTPDFLGVGDDHKLAQHDLRRRAGVEGLCRLHLEPVMKRSLLALVALLPIAASAQTPTPAQMGITPTTSPEVLQTLDNTNTWVPIGSVDSTTHTFTRVGAATLVPYPSHAALLAAITAAPSSTNTIFGNLGSMPLATAARRYTTGARLPIALAELRSRR